MKDKEELFNNDNGIVNQKEQKKKTKLGNNNIENIENQLKFEYKKEELKKNQSYNELIELKKEENLININIQYFENLLNKLKNNENEYQIHANLNVDNNVA